MPKTTPAARNKTATRYVEPEFKAKFPPPSGDHTSNISYTVTVAGSLNQGIRISVSPANKPACLFEIVVSRNSSPRVDSGDASAVNTAEETPATRKGTLQ